MINDLLGREGIEPPTRGFSVRVRKPPKPLKRRQFYRRIVKYFVRMRTDRHLIFLDNAGRYSTLLEGDVARTALTIGLKISLHPGYRSRSNLILRGRNSLGIQRVEIAHIGEDTPACAPCCLAHYVQLLQRAQCLRHGGGGEPG